VRMANGMIYGRMNRTLQQALPREKRFLLAAQIRKFPEVRAVTVDESAVRIWYTGRLQLAAIQKLAIAAVHEAKEAAITPKERRAGFRRDAIASTISLAAVQLVKHSSPEIFAMTKVVRSALVMFLARHFIQNGTQGLLKEHRPNADTLTTTAMIASILAGKPESSLTLLTLSNGAEMLTSYAAEKARTQISGLLSMDQRYVWRVSVDGAEQKVPVEQIQAGDTIAAHTGEKIVIDGKVVAGSATVNQA
jgi:cation-transporting P-type ATPase C